MLSGLGAAVVLAGLCVTVDARLAHSSSNPLNFAHIGIAWIAS